MRINWYFEEFTQNVGTVYKGVGVSVYLQCKSTFIQLNSFF